MKTICNKCGIDIKKYNDNCKACRSRKYYHENEKIRKQTLKCALARNESLIKQGICVRCEKKISIENSNLCKECLDKAKNEATIRKTYLSELGLCISCGRERAIEGKNFCEKCLIIRRKRALEYYATKKGIEEDKGIDKKYLVYFHGNKLHVGKKLMKKLNCQLITLEYSKENMIFKISPCNDKQYGIAYNDIIDIKNFREKELKEFKTIINGKHKAVYNDKENVICIDLSNIIKTKKKEDDKKNYELYLD